MKITVAGPGCPRCKQTKENLIKACKELGIEAEIVFINNVFEYMKMGVRTTPAVLIDNKIVASGFSPSVSHLKKLLSTELQ